MDIPVEMFSTARSNYSTVRAMAKRIDLDVREITSRFKKGHSIFRLANDFSVSRSVIYQRLLENGLTARPKSEQQLLRYAHMSIEDRRKITKAANKASLGSKTPLSVLKNRAKTIELRQDLSDLEKRFLRTFRTAGLVVEPLKAVLKYNIDLALTVERIAIEIHGGSWHSSDRKAIQDARKLEYLSEHGWLVIYLRERDLNGPNFHRVVALANALRENPPSVD